MRKIFSKYLLCFTLIAQSWAFLDFSCGEKLENAKVVSQDVGKPLLLTPLITSGQTERARSLSSVKNKWNTNVASYSGYFTVDEKFNSSLFFWFFRKSGKNWQKAPVLLWLQGGPGKTSMFGLFKENGPFMVTEDGILQQRNYAWTNEYNVIYIDQPVGAGFSFTEYTDGEVHSVEQAAEHLYEALAQFFLLFPKLESNAFYITGEAYASKFITALSYKIYKLQMEGWSSFNLKGLFMISPRINGFVNGWANFCFQVGIIDSRTKAKLEGIEKQIESYIESELWANASCSSKNMFYKLCESSSANLYDFTKPMTCAERNYVDFLEMPRTRMAIHVGHRPFYLFYSNFTEEIPKSAATWVEILLEHYPIAFVVGQLDAVVAYPLVINVLQNLKWSQAEEYSRAKRRPLVDEELWEDYGYYKSAGNLKEILIRGAGHMVPIDQPRATFDLLKKFINNEL